MKNTILLVLVILSAMVFCTPQTTISLSMAVIKVTAYCHPGRTASGLRVQDGILALSRDLEYNLDMRFGDNVKLEGFGTFSFQDRMASYKVMQADVWMPCRSEALRFGVKHNVMLIKIV
jgi:3D (Asp-Asp-Asp) domain-containing protein